jgi:hypothetical protein
LRSGSLTQLGQEVVEPAWLDAIGKNCKDSHIVLIKKFTAQSCCAVNEVGVC